ncbi:hypothetical protein LINGRAHAP2_LOCUS17790 [Linum grandiflorum]
MKSKRCLSKQLSMRETSRDVAWEKRRRQILRQERRRCGIPTVESPEDLTDEDLKELKGCIELGFGFNEEKGQHLANTFPALDLYFAVNRQRLSPSPVSTPSRRSVDHQQPAADSPKNDQDWKICNPGTHFESTLLKMVWHVTKYLIITRIYTTYKKYNIYFHLFKNMTNISHH